MTRLLLTSLCVFLMSSPVFAEDSANAEASSPAVATTVFIETPHAFSTAEGAKNGAAFMMIKNNGTDPDKLVSVSGDVSDIVELHETFIDPADNTMMMRKTDGIEIAAGQSVELKAAGHHVMLIGLKAPLVEGTTFPLTLTFEKAGAVPVTVSVTAPGTTMDAHDHETHGGENENEYEENHDHSTPAEHGDHQ